MRTLAVNGSIDIYLDSAGGIAIAEGLAAVQFSCEEAVRAVRGEMLYAADQGVPVFDTAFVRVRLAQFEAAARAAILAVPNVVAVDEFTADVTGEVLRYNAVIRSTFGAFETATNGL